MKNTHPPVERRVELAKKSLRGVSVGDAFGESFFGDTDQMILHIKQRKIPPSTWEFTDDTVMAIAIYKQLEKNGSILQDNLVLQFVINHEKDPNRGYGATSRRILREIGEGRNWREISREVFDGMGSMGNGAAMRASPIGAFYYDDRQTVKELAKQSAEVTHSNIEGMAGAVAIAISTAIATRAKEHNEKITPVEFIESVVKELPDTDTKAKINKAISVPYHYSIETVKSILGNGSNMMAQDTVPFAIWCAAYNLGNLEEALWKAVSVLGDRDTICAMVGGMVIMSSDQSTIPSDWLGGVENYELTDFWNT